MRCEHSLGLAIRFPFQMLQHVERLDDQSVSVDLLRSGIVRSGRLDLEAALVLLPILGGILFSTYEEHALVAIDALAELLRIFGQLIKNTRAAAQDMLGVDLSAEARLQRCQAAFEHFASSVPRLQALAATGGSVGVAATALLEHIGVYLDLR